MAAHVGIPAATDRFPAIHNGLACHPTVIQPS
jgi:hypothetical protein